jgi:PAS domain S-box-containing protein
MGLKEKSKKELEEEVAELQRRIAELEAHLQEGSPSGKILENPVEVTRLMLEYANDAIYIFQDGYLKYVNAKTIEITGYSSEEFLTKPGMDLVHPEDRAIIYDRYLKRTRGDEVPNLYPYRIFDKQGRIHWLEVSSVMMTWEGRPAQLSFMRDITEKKAAEEALRRSERLRTDIINFLPDATFAIDRQGRVTAWNRAMEALTGVASQDMIGKGHGEYALAFYGKREPILIDKVLDPSLPMTGRILSFQSGDDFLLAEKEFVQNGQTLILWCKAGVMKDARGQVLGALESLRVSRPSGDERGPQHLLKKRENDIREAWRSLLNIKELVLPYVHEA